MRSSEARITRVVRICCSIRISSLHSPVDLRLTKPARVISASPGGLPMAGRGVAYLSRQAQQGVIMMDVVDIWDKKLLRRGLRPGMSC